MISVVIPLYNKGVSVGATLETVLTQTVMPMEVIVVDDGSTDNGVEVVMQYVCRGVRLVRQSNQGVSAARNKGIQLANAPHIAFLDADDEWFPSHIEQLTRLIDLYPDAGMFSTAHRIRRGGRVFEPRSIFNKGWIGYVSDFFEAYATGLALINSSTACVRKDALMSIGGFPVGVRRGEDLIVWMKLALSYPVAHIAEVTAEFNQEAINRSDLQSECEPPGSLKFMASLLENESIIYSQRRSIEVLFDRVSLVTAANFQLKGDELAAGSIASLALKSGRYWVFILIALANIMPKWVLKAAKRMRHRRVL